jgi:hypothetical protein
MMPMNSLCCSIDATLERQKTSAVETGSFRLKYWCYYQRFNHSFYMKRISVYTGLSIVLFLFCNVAFGQTKPKAKGAVKPAAVEKGALFFDKTHIDMGSVQDVNEPIPVTFTFRNIGKGPVTISGVKVSCSCLAAEWPKIPLKFNEEGKITILYYPKGQSGPQSKEITVYTNGYPDNYLLKVAVYVNDKNAQQAKLYPSVQGNLRFTTYDVNFNNLNPESTDSFELGIYNPTDRTVRIMGIKTPDHIRVEPSSMYIASQHAITVKLRYYALMTKDYGKRKDEVLITTYGDTLFPEKKLLINAVINEDFSKLKEKERNNPPVFEAITPVIDLDTLDLKSIVTAEFIVTNKGKSPMYIRKAFGTCGCTEVEYDSNKPIKRNKTGIIRVTYNTTYEIGPVSKKIFVITNTPQQTQHEMLLKANVVYRKKR